LGILLQNIWAFENNNCVQSGICGVCRWNLPSTKKRHGSDNILRNFIVIPSIKPNEIPARRRVAIAKQEVI
jgi:hypothetical protein